MFVCYFVSIFSVPSAVRTPEATAINSTSIEVSWATPLCPNGIITEYRLYYRQYDTVQTGSINIISGYTVVIVRGLKYTFTHLQTFKNYTFIVQAVVGGNLLGSIEQELLQRTFRAGSDEPPSFASDATTSQILIQNFSSTSDESPLLASDATTSQPPSQTGAPYLIADPRQIKTGRVM